MKKFLRFKSSFEGILIGEKSREIFVVIAVWDCAESLIFKDLSFFGDFGCGCFHNKHNFIFKKYFTYNNNLHVVNKIVNDLINQK